MSPPDSGSLSGDLAAYRAAYRSGLEAARHGLVDLFRALKKDLEARPRPVEAVAVEIHRDGPTGPFPISIFTSEAEGIWDPAGALVSQQLKALPPILTDAQFDTVVVWEEMDNPPGRVHALDQPIDSLNLECDEVLPLLRATLEEAAEGSFPCKVLAGLHDAAEADAVIWPPARPRGLLARLLRK